VKPTEWAYFAGLFDGEGSVTVAQVTRKTATVSCRAGVTVTNMALRISNNNPRPLLELEKKFGGRVRLHSPNLPVSYVWIIQGHRSVEFAIGVLPYLRIKLEQVGLYIDFWELRRRKAMGRIPLSEDELAARRTKIDEIKAARAREGGKVYLVSQP